MYYCLIYEPKETNKGEEYQPDFLPDSLIVWWKVTMKNWIILKLWHWWILMKKCSVVKFVEFFGTIPLTNIDFQRNIFLFKSFNFFFFFFSLFVFFFFLFRSEKDLLGGHLSPYQGKLTEPGDMDVTNENQQQFALYVAMTDRVYENLSSVFVGNQDANGEIENGETGKSIYSEDTEPSEQNSEVHESNLASGYFMPKIVTRNKIATNISSLNKKPRILFDMQYQWARSYTKIVFSKINK